MGPSASIEDVVEGGCAIRGWEQEETRRRTRNGAGRDCRYEAERMPARHSTLGNTVLSCKITITLIDPVRYETLIRTRGDLSRVGRVSYGFRIN